MLQNQAFIACRGGRRSKLDRRHLPGGGKKRFAILANIAKTPVRF